MKTQFLPKTSPDAIRSVLRCNPSDFAAPYVRHAEAMTKRGGPLVLALTTAGLLEIVQGYQSPVRVGECFPLSACLATDLRPRHLNPDSHPARCYLTEEERREMGRVETVTFSKEDRDTFRASRNLSTEGEAVREALGITV